MLNYKNYEDRKVINSLLNGYIPQISHEQAWDLKQAFAVNNRRD
jgi:hypothetical protein